MKFPRWVETPTRQTKAQRASKRCRYLLYRAALEIVPGGNITQFAAEVGLERSTLHTFVAQGRFSLKTAIKIEKAVGRDHTRYEWLTEPLLIAATE